MALSTKDLFVGLTLEYVEVGSGYFEPGDRVVVRNDGGWCVKPSRGMVYWLGSSNLWRFRLAEGPW